MRLRQLNEALDAADRYCREGGHLLSLAAPPEALAFQRWYLCQFIAQIKDETPLSWPQWLSGLHQLSTP